MPVTFKTYVRSESTLTDLGNVISLIPGGKLKFCPGTIDRYNSKTIKAYSMLLIDKADKSTTIPLSVKLSTKIAQAFEDDKPKKDILAAISKLPVYENEDGIITIGRPAGEASEELELAVSELKKSTVTYEELIAV